MAVNRSPVSLGGEMVYDVHCHLHEFKVEDLEEVFNLDRGIRVIAVSDDLESSLRTLDLEKTYPDRVIACVGLHPWSIGEEPLHRAETIVRMAEREGVRCVGEVGVDARFLPQYTWNIQVRVFSMFIELSRELGAFLNIHAPDAWRSALAELLQHDVRKAVFHWYTGPVELVDVIGGRGYMISVNPAVRIQEKHARIAQLTPLDHLVFESDAPYNYRGLHLNPLMIRDTINLVARLRNIDANELASKARWNTERLLI
jgi:TatD DNase family protein